MVTTNTDQVAILLHALTGKTEHLMKRYSRKNKRLKNLLEHNPDKLRRQQKIANSIYIKTFSSSTTPQPSKEELIRNLLKLFPENLMMRYHIAGFVLHDHPAYRTYGGEITMDIPAKSGTWMPVFNNTVTTVNSQDMQHMIDVYTSDSGLELQSRELLELYFILKEIGKVYLASAIAGSKFAKEYNLLRLFHQRNAHMPTGQQWHTKKKKISAQKYMAKFESMIMTNERLREHYIVIYGNDTERLLMEAMSDCFAAYFMGMMMVPRIKFAPLPPRLYTWIHQFIHAKAEIISS